MISRNLARVGIRRSRVPRPTGADERDAVAPFSRFSRRAICIGCLVCAIVATVGAGTVSVSPRLSIAPPHAVPLVTTDDPVVTDPNVASPSPTSPARPSPDPAPTHRSPRKPAAVPARPAPLLARTIAMASPAPAAPPPAPSSPPPSNRLRFGLTYPEILTRVSPARLGQALDDAVALGVGWIRLDLPWDAIQPQSPTASDWSAFDAVVAAASARHIGVLPILQYTPVWARPLTCSQSDHCQPADPNQFSAFAAAAAGRYAPRGVHAWEIWNEPNTGGAWLPQPDPASYTALVQATVPAIKAVDPAATVISGGLAPAATNGRDISQLDFVSGFARAGGLALVDAVGYHPYSYPVPATFPDPGNAWQQISNTPTSLHGLMASFAYPNMKIWATEYGAPTNGPGIAATPSDYHLSQSPDHVDEALQAQMATQSIQLANASPVLAALFWYTQIDAGTDPSNRENFFGLRRFDSSPKPAYSALQQAIAAARG